MSKQSTRVILIAGSRKAEDDLEKKDAKMADDGFIDYCSVASATPLFRPTCLLLLRAFSLPLGVNRYH